MNLISDITGENIEDIFDGYINDDYKKKTIASVNSIATKSFIDYGASVILGRAIPDLRDGLKFAQRRALYAMKGLGLSDKGAPKKSARIAGDCLIKDTLISTSKGLIPIQDIKVGNKVYTQFGLKKVTHLFYQEEQPLLKISFNDIFNNTSTYNHKYKIFNENCEFEFKEASQLKIGDYIVMQPSFFDIKDNYEEEECYVLGQLLSDGNIDRNKQPGLKLLNFTSSSIEILNRINNYFGNKSNIIDRKYTSKLTIYDRKQSADFIKKFELKNKYAFNINSANKFLNKMSNINLMSFLSGFIDGDGFIRKGNKKEIIITSIDIKFLTFLSKILFDRFNINSDVKLTLEENISRIYKGKIIRSNFNCYNLSFTGDSVDILSYYLNLSHKRKSERLNNYNKNNNPTQNNIIPFIGKKIFSILREKHLGGGWYKNEDGAKFRLAIKYNSGAKIRKPKDFLDKIDIYSDTVLGMRILEKLEIIDKEAYFLLKNILDKKMSFIKIKKIEMVSSDITYDFTVEDVHEFIANGFVSSNCIGKYHPHGDASAYETMVNMAQPWKNNLPFIDGQGNWGSIDGDSEASSRYCLTADSLVKTATGELIRIGSISDKDESDININILSVNKKVNNANKFFNSGFHDIYKVTTDEGLSIRGSENHPVLIWTQNNGKPSVMWKQLPELNKGDYLIIDRTYIKDSRKSSVFQLNNALIAGALVSEGSISEKRITFCNTDKKYYDKVINAFKANYKGVIHSYSRILPSGKEIYELDIQNKQNEFFKSSLFNELKDKKAKDKSIPDSIFNSYQDCQILFLRALFEGDGSVFMDKKRFAIGISYTSLSNILLSEVQILLLNFGVLSRIRPEKENMNRITIHSFENILNFGIRINFLTAKSEKLFDFISMEMKRKNSFKGVSKLDKDYIPYISDYIRSKNKSLYLKKYNFDRYLKLEENFKLIELGITNKDDIDFLRDTLNNRYYFAEVKSIEKEASQEEVFSIHVNSDCHSFIANGFINHNTEAKFTKNGFMLFRDIDKELVDFMPNYDGTEEEPVVLPAPYPAILINGVLAGSIAVGMATSILPHNPTEVMNALMLILKNRLAKKETTPEEILEIIPAPDFPTGGIIYNTQSMLDIIKTGKGGVRIRAKHNIETINKKQSIIITEIPFTKKKATLIDEIVAIKKNNKDNQIVSGIANIKDESDKNIRIVIDIKNGWDPEIVWNYLLKHSTFDTSISYFSIVVDTVKKDENIGFAPREYGVLTILERYLDFRMDLLIRKWEFIKKNSEAKLHILEGIIKALDIINQVIECIKRSKKFDVASENLVNEFGFSKLQSIAILNMRLSKLTSLEKNELIAESKELEKTIKEAIKIIKNENYRFELLTNDIKTVEKEIGYPRRSTIVNEFKVISTESVIQEENCIIYVTDKGYVKRVNAKQIKSGKIDMELTESDFIAKTFETTTHNSLLVIANNGQVFSTKSFNIPDSSSGVFIKNIFDIEGDYNTFISDMSENILMLTNNGLIKQTSLKDFSGSTRKSGLPGINLKDNFILNSFLVKGDEEIIIATKNAKAIKFSISEVSTTGRSSQGVNAMKVKVDDNIIGSIICANNKIELITENNVSKVLKPSDFNLQSRAGVGVFVLTLTKKSGQLIELKEVL